MKSLIAPFSGLAILAMTGAAALAAPPEYCALYAREYANQFAAAAGEAPGSEPKIQDEAYYRCLNMDQNPPMPTSSAYSGLANDTADQGGPLEPVPGAAAPANAASPAPIADTAAPAAATSLRRPTPPWPPLPRRQRQHRRRRPPTTAPSSTPTPAVSSPGHRPGRNGAGTITPIPSTRRTAPSCPSAPPSGRCANRGRTPPPGSTATHVPQTRRSGQCCTPRCARGHKLPQGIMYAVLTVVKNSAA